MANTLVLTRLAKKITGAKRLLSEYKYCTLDLKEEFLSNMSLKYYACHFKTQMTAILPAYFITILLFFQQCICKTINTFSILPNIVYGRHIYCPIIFQETAEIILQYYGKEDFLRKKKCF